MKQALGLVEIEGLSTAIVAADAMAKAANIQIVEIENTKGLGYMTIKAVGDVGAVTAAVNVGSQVGAMNQRLVSSKIIPRPSDYVGTFFVDPDDKTKKETKENMPEAADAVKEEEMTAKETAEMAETAEKSEPAEETEAKGEPEPEAEAKPESLEEQKPEQKKSEPVKKAAKEQQKRTKNTPKAAPAQKKDPNTEKGET